MSPIIKDDVKKATFALHPHKAPRPDGVTMEFYQKCWKFMGEDIWLMVEEFCRKGKFVKEVNNTLIALIPKKKSCSIITDYRPISLCNSLYKIISKVIVDRLKLVLDKIVSPEQHGFTPGREIVDSIIRVVETMHSMKRSKMQGMVVKLDVSKAYDQVIWYFLFFVLERFGFDSSWINCIKHCVTSISYSIIVNGSIEGFLQAMNGLRQGDPLSTFLFVLMGEILGRNIKKLVETILWKGVHIHDSIDPISHSQFADHTILFGEAIEKEAKVMKMLLNDYEKGSRQSMNIDKSMI